MQQMNDLTPRAKEVLALALKEAKRFNHAYVGTEHLLLGLIKLGQGVAVNVLEGMGVDLERVRMEVEKHVGPHPETKMTENIPYTPRAKKVLALAGKEAEALKAFLRRYRTHFAGTFAGRRGNRRTGIRESGSGSCTSEKRNFKRIGPELRSARKRGWVSAGGQ